MKHQGLIDLVGLAVVEISLVLFHKILFLFKKVDKVLLCIATFLLMSTVNLLGVRGPIHRLHCVSHFVTWLICIQLSLFYYPTYSLTGKLLIFCVSLQSQCLCLPAVSVDIVLEVDETLASKWCFLN